MSLTDDQLKFISTHLKDVEQHIIQAADAACKQNHGKLEAQKVAAIASKFAQNEPIPVREPVSVWGKIANVLTNVPGIIWISALLAVTFGVLSAVYPGSSSLSDLAKVFAGAIVGASGASGATSRLPDTSR